VCQIATGHAKTSNCQNPVSSDHLKFNSSSKKRFELLAAVAVGVPNISIEIN